MYYFLLDDLADRPRFTAKLKERELNVVFHYVPLHAVPSDERLGRASGSLRHTEALAERLVRHPLWPGLENHHQHV